MNCIDIGICVRDDNEAFVPAKTMSFTPLCFVPVGEPLDLFNVIKWLSDMQMDNVNFVMDSKTINDDFHSNKPDVSESGHANQGARDSFIHNS